ncbi:hypothetical protein [Aestuariivirga sp.]|uniref:hypothetical protein n=1 Tax=Aestuariivirga sp. TaxID=2650926 RepID=UPI0035930761
MKTILMAGAAATLFMALASTAQASMPEFHGTCPMGVKIESDKHANVLINGHKASVKKFNENYWEARHNDFILSIAKEGSEATVTYTAKGGANGVCTVSSKHGASSGSASNAGAGIPSEDEQACLQAVSIQTNNGDVTLLQTSSSEANNEVIIGVGANKAKWKCLVKNGQVAEVSSLTDEGAL